MKDKDWIGESNKSIFTPLASSNHSNTERDTVDFYATSPESIDFLRKKYQIPEYVLEPCCGSGTLSEKLISLGHKVISEDLYNHNYGTVGKDFLKRKEMPDGYNCILTNFPYKYITEFTLHSLEILKENGILISFAKTTFLEGSNRYNNLFSKYPPRYVFQFVKRIECGKGGIFDKKQSSAVSYAWFVWEKGYKGNPEIIWLA